MTHHPPALHRLPLIAGTVALTTLLVLAGCGYKGPLEAPPDIDMTPPTVLPNTVLPDSAIPTSTTD